MPTYNQASCVALRRGGRYLRYCGPLKKLLSLASTGAPRCGQGMKGRSSYFGLPGREDFVSVCFSSLFEGLPYAVPASLSVAVCLACGRTSATSCFASRQEGLQDFGSLPWKEHPLSRDLFLIYRDTTSRSPRPLSLALFVPPL